jgi:hypothetical protein
MSGGDFYLGRCGVLQCGLDGVELGLDEGGDVDLQLEPAPLALNLDLLLLDQAPLFFKLRVDPAPIRHV